MKIQLYIFVTIAILISVLPAQAKLVTRAVDYQDGDTPLSGFLAYDDVFEGRRPAVLVVHEWWGLNEYARQRAEQLANLGYLAFAVDMYGTGKVTDHPKQAGEWANEVSRNKAAWQRRALAGLAVLNRQPQADPDRVAAIGYCFGGGTVQQLVYAGANLKGVVSFHGSLQMPPAGIAAKTAAQLLICHGGADELTPPDQLAAYLSAMAASGLNYQVNIYGGAKHGFTNPRAGAYGIPALAYSPVADRRSWEAMRRFLGELFAD